MREKDNKKSYTILQNITLSENNKLRWSNHWVSPKIIGYEIWNHGVSPKSLCTGFEIMVYHQNRCVQDLKSYFGYE